MFTEKPASINTIIISSKKPITIIDLMMMLISVGILWMFAYTKYFVSRREGVLMVVGFLIYMGWLFYLL